MRLSVWLKQNKRTHAMLAEEMGVHIATVDKWTTGRMMPRYDACQLISIITRGEVTIQDLAAGYTAAEAKARKRRQFAQGLAADHAAAKTKRKQATAR